MPIYLKSIKKQADGWPITGALLVEPEVEGIVKNDEELYEAVRKNGRALVLEPDDARVEYTPAHFENMWRGD